MAPTWTIRRLLAWMAEDFGNLGIGTPRLDAELLIAHVLELDRVRLYMDLDRPLSTAELSALRALVARRRLREPVAYLIGRREFYRRPFAVSPAVLIPRPDTETLVERALALLPPDQPARALDLCTGSGAIAITLAAERPELQVDATDLSPAALELARNNAETLGGTERIQFYEGDLFAALPGGARYRLIAANPPYVPTGELPGLAPELRHEPQLALAAGADGLDALRRLCAGVADWLEPGAALLFEVGQGQAPAVLELLGRVPELHALQAHRDLGGIERVVEARRVGIPESAPPDPAPENA